MCAGIRAPETLIIFLMTISYREPSAYAWICWARSSRFLRTNSSLMTPRLSGAGPWNAIRWIYEEPQN